MELKLRITTLAEKKLIGKRITMSLSNNKTAEVWRGFMPRRKEILNNIGTDLYSIQVYPPMYFVNFNPAAKFEKWASFEVTHFDTVPDDMETIALPGGLYAVFLYKGLNTDTTIFEYIFRTWLPNSEYALDHRPHFEILGAKYKNGDLNSEEEIWIPIIMKQ
jgi:AraC family transcriptional regulator